MTAYYNEIEPFAAEWLRNLIAAGHLPAGDVDTRSIVDVAADDLVGYSQCHFFAGIGGWALAARLAGWPDDRELWTGSCPCQPFSVAGKGAGTDDERHLWPHQFRLIRARRPAVWMGEQVAAAVGKAWLDGVLADLEGIGYAGRAAVVPACSVDAPHRRDRLWIVTERSRAVDHRVGARLEGLARHGDDAPGWAQPDRPVATTGGGSVLADSECFGVRGKGCGAPATTATGVQGAHGERQWFRADTGTNGLLGSARDGAVAVTRGDGHDPANFDAAEPSRDRQDDGLPVGGGGELRGSAWAGAGWIIGHDGKARRVEPGIRLLAHGVPARVGRLRAYGNAIVPQVAAEVIGAYLDCFPANDNVPGAA